MKILLESGKEFSSDVYSAPEKYLNIKGLHTLYVNILLRKVDHGRVMCTIILKIMLHKLQLTLEKKLSICSFLPEIAKEN